MDFGGVLLLMITGVLSGGPLYLFLHRRQVPESHDWSGRPMGDYATDPHDGLGE